MSKRFFPRRVSLAAARLALCTSAVVIAACAATAGSARQDSAAATVPAAPLDSFRVSFETSRGTFVVAVNREWAPLGADRIRELVDAKFFDENRFFRAVPGFVVQFGLNGNPKVNEGWDTLRIADDAVRKSNLRGTLSFASQGPDTRSHQIFINLVDNARLDPLGFAPFGRVVEGMDVVDSLYTGYGENPDQGYIQTLGNSYLTRMFPKLDYVKTARVSKD